LKLQEAGLVPNSQDCVEGYPAMIFQEGDFVWHETSGEEASLAHITEVDFELYILVDVRTDEQFCFSPDNLKPFDS
jgi:hypothetical protein